MSIWSSWFSRLKQQMQTSKSLAAAALGVSLCSMGLVFSPSAEAQLNFDTSAYLCTNPGEQISHEAAQYFNDGWFLTISNFRSRWGEALTLLEKAQEEKHPYARIAMLYLQSKMLNQSFPYAENQFDLIPVLVGDDPVGVTLSAQIMAAATDFLSKTPQNINRLIKALDRAIAIDYVHAYYVKGRILMMMDRSDEGLELVLKGAQKGSALAKHHIASLVIHGLLDLSPEQAFDFLQSAVDDGDYGSLQDLAYCYEKGFGVRQDMEKAMSLYKTSMQYGDSGSALAFARLQLTSDNPKYVEAFIALNFAYNNRKAEAANALGYLYMTGLGVKQDKAKGLALMEKAAQAGDITALENVIACYSNGQGAAPDPTKVAMYQERLQQMNATQVAVHTY